MVNDVESVVSVARVMLPGKHVTIVSKATIAQNKPVVIV